MLGGRALAVAIVLGTLSSAGASLAQPPPPADEAEPPGDAGEARARARTLANEGLRAFKRGDYVTALARFEQAEALVPAPTIALQRARSLEKLGRLAEALDRYEAIAAAPPAADAPYVHHRAHQDAQVEAQALAPRVPAVTVIVEGEAGPGAELLIDGRSAPWSGPTDRTERRLDPGSHRFELRRRDGSRAAGGVDLAERMRTEVRLTLPPPGAPPPGGDDDATPAADGDAAWSGEEQRAAGWIAVSAAGLGLGIALVTGAAAIAVGSDLDDRCPGGACPPEAWDDVDNHDGYRTASTIGFALAGALATTGVVLLLTAPDDRPTVGVARAATAGRTEAHVGPRGVSVRVSY